MIVIVEGPDRTGKTTFCNALKSKGFLYVKDTSPRYGDLRSESAKLETYVSVLIELGKQTDIVVDRAHLTEFVYGAIERDYLNSTVVAVDKLLAAEEAALVLIMPTDLKRSSEEHGKDLREYVDTFNSVYKLSKIKRKVRGDYNSIEVLVQFIEGVRDGCATTFLERG